MASKRPVPQRDLFGRMPAPKPTAAAPAGTYRIEQFDAWDESRMVPDPGWTVPEELRLLTDDPDWQPVGKFG